MEFTKGKSVNKSQLIESLAGHFDGNKKRASDALDAIVDTVMREVARGEKVAITGFGAFEKVARPSRMVRNPRTGERKRAKKTAVPRFKAGAEFKKVTSGERKLPKVVAASKTAAKKTTATKATSASTAKTSGSKTAAKRTAAKSTTAKTAPARTATAKTTTAKRASATKAATKSSARKSTPAKASTSSTAKTTAKKSPTRTAAKKTTKRTAKKS
jgi:DNA-binding protein HU-beta